MRALTIALPFFVLALTTGCQSPPSIDGQLWGCTGDQDCVAPKRCLNKVCRAGCQTATDCAYLGANARCSAQGICLQPGGPGGGTGGGTGDTGGGGNRDNAGPPPFDPGGGGPLPDRGRNDGGGPGICLTDYDCSNGWVCDPTGFCMPPVGPDAGYVDDVWITPSDGGAYDVLDMGTNNCVNEHDQSIINQRADDLFYLSGNCGFGCATEPMEFVQCSSDCMQIETGVSPPCARCFGEMLDCVRRNCAVQCTGSDPGDVCFQCQQEHGCMNIFATCSGFVLGGDEMP